MVRLDIVGRPVRRAAALDHVGVKCALGQILHVHNAPGLVLENVDEDVADAAPFTDGGAMTEAALQMVPHPARVYVFQLKDNKPLLRLRRSGGGRFIQAGERAISDDETRDALQRQANNCSLANLVDADLRAK